MPSAGQHRLADHGHRPEPERRQRLQRARHRLRQGRQARARRSPTSTPRSRSIPSFYQAYANRALVAAEARPRRPRPRRLQRRAPDQSELRRRLSSAAATSIARTSRLDQALADFNQAIALDTNDPHAYHNRALIYQATGQHAAGDRRFHQGDLAQPDGRRALRGARPLLSRHRRLQGRARRLQRGGEARPREFYAAWTNQGLALEKLGERDKAYRRLRQGGQPQPELPPGA